MHVEKKSLTMRRVFHIWKSSTDEERDGRTMMTEKPMGRCAKFCYYTLVMLAELVLLGVLAVTLYWIIYHEGGVAWNADLKRQFNLHFLLMILGFVFLNGQAILTYRLFGSLRHIYAKLMHAFLFFGAVACVAVGFYVAFQANERVHTRNARSTATGHFYSLHSWLAIGACGLFAIQLLVGFVSFLVLVCCSRATASFRAALVPIHASFGIVIYTLGLAAALTGLMQAVRARLNGQNQNTDYRDFPEQGILINSLAMLLALLIVLMPLVTRTHVRSARAMITSSGSVAVVDMS